MEQKTGLLKLSAIIFVIIALTLGVITVIKFTKKVSADAINVSNGYMNSDN